MLVELIDDFFIYSRGYDDYELFDSFGAYRENDYRHSVPIDSPQGSGFENEDT